MEISLSKGYIAKYVYNLYYKRSIMVNLRDYYKISSLAHGRDIDADFSNGDSDYEIYMEIIYRNPRKVKIRN